MATIIFLNGCGSAGKTSIAKSIQYLSDKPWLKLSMDSLIDMMPSQYIAFGYKAQDGYFSFKQGANEHGATIEIKEGPLGSKVFSTLPTIAKILADQGSDLIIDEVILHDDELQLYRKTLTSHKIYFIGVYCELGIMQEREILRGDRAIGLSNYQIAKVHNGVQYDLEIDTTHKSSFTAAKEIMQFMKQNPKPKSFNQ